MANAGINAIGAGDFVGAGVNSIMAYFGNDQARLNQFNWDRSKQEESGGTAPSPQPMVIENKIILDGRQIGEAVNEFNYGEAQRG